jgi:small conductance mechanosensitive channel
MDAIFIKLNEWLVEYGLKVIAAAIILVIGYVVAKIVRSIIRRMMQRGRMDHTLVSFFSSLAYFGILAIVLIACLAQLGVQTTSVVAMLGAAGLAVGLALQGSLANFASGILMIIFKPFKAGDFIEGGGVAGVVEEIGIFATGLRSADNKKLIVPNAKMMGDNIVNHTNKAMRRVDIVVGVSYKDDIDKVKKTLEAILSEDGRILKDPAPMIGVLELADSKVNIGVRPWVKTDDYWDVFFALQETIKKRFDAEGIRIPCPQRDVHLHKAE